MVPKPQVQLRPYTLEINTLFTITAEKKKIAGRKAFFCSYISKRWGRLWISGMVNRITQHVHTERYTTRLEKQNRNTSLRLKRTCIHKNPGERVVAQGNNLRDNFLIENSTPLNFRWNISVKSESFECLADCLPQMNLRSWQLCLHECSHMTYTMPFNLLSLADEKCYCPTSIWKNV